MNVIEQDAEPKRIVVPEQSFSKRDVPVVQAQQSASLIQAIATAASNPHVDMDRAERLFRMHQEMVRYEAEAAFNDAMARAQANIVPVIRNRRNTHTNSTYADLAAINEQIVPLYTAEGLAVSFDTETKNEADPIPQGEYRTIALVTHRQGHSRRYHIDLPLDDAGSQGKVNKTKVQAKGSTTSFGRRYLSLMIFNVSTDDDDDGNGGRRRDRTESDQQGEHQNGQQTAAARPEAAGKKQPYKDADLERYLPEWQAAGHVDRNVAKLQTRYTFTPEQLKKIEAAK